MTTDVSPPALTSDRGSALLRAALGLTGSPFPWQTRLLSELLAARLPEVVDLPTGLGKTSVMAIWLVARALGAPVPRRLVYVVDRRAVVDQATAVAEGLRGWVEQTPEVRAALALTGPLPISTLRGRHVDNRQWLADPAAPAIVLGTVDMVGSRLLFSGYGVSTKMRPYHAGLLGADSLIVLDEAHLVPPFERLLARLASGIDDDGRPLGIAPGIEGPAAPPLKRMSLSATGQMDDAAQVFRLEADDRAHPVVQQRLAASKRLMRFPAVDAKSLPDTLAAHAWALSAQGQKPVRIIVFTNSRDHAQKVQAALLKLIGKGGKAPVELFVGARRVHEREQAARRLAELGFVAGAVPVVGSSPAFLVATSAAEVGVDLDAQHAVCDLVAWERMVQRLGRINRRGLGDASVILVPATSDDDKLTDRLDAVARLIEALPRLPDGAADGSPAALVQLKADAALRELITQASTPAPLHPPLTRAVVEAWAMTSLEQHTGRPEVAPWLRGWLEDDEPPQMRLLWREHLPLASDGSVLPAPQLDAFLDAAGPHLAEVLEVEQHRVLDWLLTRAKDLQETRSKPAEPDAAEAHASRRLRPDEALGVLLGADGTSPRVLTAASLAIAPKRDLERWLQGATLMLDARIGGLSDGLLDVEADEPALDVTTVGTAETPGPVPFRVLLASTDNWPPLADGWRDELSLPIRSTDEGVTDWLLVRSRTDQQAGSEEGRSGAQRAQLLTEHQDWAEAAARRLGQALQLPAVWQEALATAAALHDEGKRAARWQQAFHAPDGGRPPYAKTLGRPDLAVLDGYRHEFGSLPHAEASARLRALPAAMQALCLHLIAAHHGAARPVIRTAGAPEPPSLLARRAQAVALRYAHLSRQWGPWGLAWWEALLRAADQQASRENDEGGPTHG